MKLLSIVGARPQFVKLAPLCLAIQRRNGTAHEPIEHLIVHTGQHYDPELSAIFFEQLRLPRPGFELQVGSGSHAVQTALMLERIERVLQDAAPDMVLVYGDTNSTLAGALAAAKLHIPVGHVEAGLRSFNRRMPEELNRVAADHLSDLLLAPTETAMDHLRREGLARRAVRTGDVMFDAVRLFGELAERRSGALQRRGLQSRRFGLVTLHRAENTDQPQRLAGILQGLNEVAASGLPLLLPIHPRTSRAIKQQLSDWVPHPQLLITSPVGHLDMLCLLRHARIVLTDSGGLQKEAFFLNCPCVTLRDESEWTETISAGGNIIAGAAAGRIVEAVQTWSRRLSDGPPSFSSNGHWPFGRGDAADHILEAVFHFHQTGQVD